MNRRLNRKLDRLDEGLAEMNLKLKAILAFLMFLTVTIGGAIALVTVIRLIYLIYWTWCAWNEYWTAYCVIALAITVWFVLAYGLCSSIRDGTFCDDEAGVIGLFGVLPFFALLIMGGIAHVVEKRELAGMA